MVPEDDGLRVVEPDCVGIVGGAATTATLLKDTPVMPALAKLVFSSVLNATELDKLMEPKEVVTDAADAAEVAITL